MKRTTQHPDRTDRRKRALAQRERELAAWTDDPEFMGERVYGIAWEYMNHEDEQADKIATCKADIANLRAKLRMVAA